MPWCTVTCSRGWICGFILLLYVLVVNVQPARPGQARPRHQIRRVLAAQTVIKPAPQFPPTREAPLASVPSLLPGPTPVGRITSGPLLALSAQFSPYSPRPSLPSHLPIPAAQVARFPRLPRRLLPSACGSGDYVTSQKESWDSTISPRQPDSSSFSPTRLDMSWPDLNLASAANSRDAGHLTTVHSCDWQVQPRRAKAAGLPRHTPTRNDSPTASQAALHSTSHHSTAQHNTGTSTWVHTAQYLTFESISMPASQPGRACPPCPPCPPCPHKCDHHYHQQHQIHQLAQSCDPRCPSPSAHVLRSAS